MALKIIRSVRDFSLDWNLRVGFVPTMGAFHEWHLELMRTAKRECELCVVSIFVNPTQFAPQEDFSSYPRQEALDFEMAESVGVDCIFAPIVDEMYLRQSTSIQIQGVSEKWEGAHRPGHFDGVATVVAKLFHIIRPNRAYFGLKDYQQCVVIKRMVENLNFSLELKFVETVREQDGLAMSSRNAYLSPELRAKAPQLFQVISALGTELGSRTSGSERIELALQDSRRTLVESGFDVDYLALVDPHSLEPLSEVAADSRIIVAARLGHTRLIDNCALHHGISR